MAQPSHVGAQAACRRALRAARATASVEGQLLPGRFAVSPSYQSWIVGQSQEASERVVRHLNAQMRRHREWARQDARGEERQASAWPAPRGEQEQRNATRRSGPLRCEEVNFSVYDFSTLFPSLDHAVVRKAKTLVSRIYGEQARKLKVRVAFLWVERRREERSAGSVRWVAERGRDTGSVKYLGEREIEVLLDYILDSAHVTFGDTVYRQRLGVPIGFGASPMIANMALAQCELEGIEKMVRSAMSPLGARVSTPRGVEELTTELRVELAELAGKVQRCCRNIDDILFIDLDKGEVKWTIDTPLRLKTIST